MRLTRKNFKRNPNRGIFTEMAHEQGVSRQAIHDGIFKFGNPRLISIAVEKVKEREKIHKQL
jgi:predicted DNA-binding protein YlxM (UPF0122 family)